MDAVYTQITQDMQDMITARIIQGVDEDMRAIFQAGNVSALRQYWVWGEGARRIRWGTDGDLTRCHRFLNRYMTSDAAWGTCQNYHKLRFGRPNPRD